MVSLVGEHRLYSALAQWLRLRSRAWAQYQLSWHTDLVALQHVGPSLHCSGSRLLCGELSEVGPGLHALPRSKPLTSLLPHVHGYIRIYPWCWRLSVLVHVLSHFSRVQLCMTLWTVVPQASLSMRILQARILEWVASSVAPDPAESRGAPPPPQDPSPLRARTLRPWDPSQSGCRDGAPAQVTVA